MKHISIKVLCGIMAMVLLTTCVIGTTLARYTTGDSATDTARVAKWGIELAVGGTLFGQDYADTSVDASLQHQITAGTAHSVSASVDANVVAPGTKNDTGIVFSISGAPEVDYAVDVTSAGNEDIYLAAGNYGMMVQCTWLTAATNVNGLYTKTGEVYTQVTTDTLYDGTTVYYELRDASEVQTNAYYPIAWTVTGTGDFAATFAPLNATDMAALATTISNAINGLDGEANAPGAAGFRLTWAWAIDQNSGADTILGNLIAEKNNIVVLGSDGNYHTISVSDNVATANGETVANLDVKFDLAVTVQQVD